MRESIFKDTRFFLLLKEKDSVEIELQNSDFYVIKKFQNLIKKMYQRENNNEILLLTRGFSIKDRHGDVSDFYHQDFIENDLRKFFIVGQKGAMYFQETVEELKELYNEDKEDRDALIENINGLYSEANKQILTKESKRIAGQISKDFINIDRDTPLQQLHQKKMFLTAFLHNVGDNWAGKSTSPMLSFSYGNQKKQNAKKFATGSLQGYPQHHGLIILAYVPNADSYTFETNNLKKKLKSLGVDWYPDTYSEIFLLDGIMPHRILGIFDVRVEDEERFIINPWLEEMFQNNRRFNYEQGIEIDQGSFNEHANELGYGAFVLQIDGMRYNKANQNEELKETYGFE